MTKFVCNPIGHLRLEARFSPDENRVSITNADGHCVHQLLAQWEDPKLQYGNPNGPAARHEVTESHRIPCAKDGITHAPG